jgi:hypothetical protein
MKFAGRLQVAGDPDPGVAVVVNLHAGRLAVTQGAEELGSWALGDVRVSPLGRGRFALNIEEDQTIFAADDPVGFAHEAIPAIETARRGSPSGLLERLWSLFSEPSPPVGADPPELARPPVLTVVQSVPDPEEPEPAAPTAPIARPTPASPRPRRCVATRRDGLPCRCPIVGASGLCFSHDPDRKAERLAARRRGGKAARKTPRSTPGTDVMTRVLHRLDELIDEVQSGEIEPEVARAVADLVQAVCSTIGLGALPPSIEFVDEPTPRSATRNAL